MELVPVSPVFCFPYGALGLGVRRWAQCLRVPPLLRPACWQLCCRRPGTIGPTTPRGKQYILV
eukprot:9283043-Heterocapsa_arctica.AAC.1